MTNSFKLDFLDLSSIKKYKKKNFKDLSPIEIINKLVDENGKKIDSGSDSKLLIEIIDDIIFDYEDEYLDKPDEIKKLNKKKYKKERKFDIINLLEKYKRLELYTLNIEEKKNKIKLLIIIDNKTGIFSIYVGDSNYRRYCGYITFTTSPYKVENNILKENFINIKYNYAYIEWIKPKERCNVLLNGTQILNTFINLCYLLNIDRVDLQDGSNINCIYKGQKMENSFKYYKIIHEGKTSYEKNNFLPSPEKRMRKDIDRQILNPHLPPLSYRDNNLSNKLLYTNFYSNYKNTIKLLNNFDMLYILNIYNIIENNILLKRRILSDYDIPNNFYNKLNKLSNKINKLSNNIYNFPLKNYVKKINENDCKNFNDFQKLFIDDNEFRDILKYICLEYTRWFNLDILKEVEGLYDSLDTLNDVNYYFLILK